MGFGPKSLKFREMMGLRNLHFYQKYQKFFNLSRTKMLQKKEAYQTTKTPVPSYKHNCLMKH